MADETCGAHCRACDRCFSSTTSFDRHRIGSFKEDTRRCGEPDSLKRPLVPVEGACTISSAERRETTVWRT